MAPGVVNSSLGRGLRDSHWAGRVLEPMAYGLARLIAVSPEDCGEYMWNGLYAAKAGWSRRDKHGEDVGDKNLWAPEGAKETVWEHTLAATSE